jgi:ADP-heptose:LPS heptosyltransferase
MSVGLTCLGTRLVDVRKIAVVRANGLGDFIFTLPALASLRAAYPTAEIVLLGRRWHQELLSGRPGPVDRVVSVPNGAIGDEVSPTATPTEVAAFLAAMRNERFDLALQVHGGGRNSNPFTLQLGARYTAGLRTPDAPPLDRWLPYLYFQPEVVRYLEAVALVGAPPVTLEPHLHLMESDLEASRAVLPEAPAPLAVLHPGAGDPRRRWPAEQFAAVGDALAGAGACIAVIGLPPEAHLVQRVVRAMRAPALDLAGRLSMSALVGLLARAAVVVSNDSGPLHLAHAVGTATVGIYWCGNLINSAPLTRGRHRPLASWRLTCPVCGRNCIGERCSHDASFVADVAAEDVAAAALDLLAAHVGHRDARTDLAVAPAGDGPLPAPAPCTPPCQAETG